MDCSKMLALLGAMSVMAATVPAQASVTDARSSKTDGMVLYSGAQGDVQNVNWHSSHSSHSSHCSHSSHSSHSSSRF